MMRRTIRAVTVIAIVLSTAACGGGGGGKSSSYAGTWRVTAAKVRDECGIPQNTFTSDVIVNQDGDRVVVNSGNHTLVGLVNENDGFDAATDTYSFEGCLAAAAYSFRNAGDGTADVGLALALKCGGATCVMAFGGSATKLTGRSASNDTADHVDAIDESLTLMKEQGSKMTEYDTEVDLGGLTESLADETATLQ